MPIFDTKYITSRLKHLLTYRVGFVGHRPDRMQNCNRETLSKVMHEILSSVQKEVRKIHLRNSVSFSDNPPDFIIICALAEGTDRMFTIEAMNLGYSLICPMPFRQEEYEDDFKPEKSFEPDSLKEFRELLKRAEKESESKRIELAGNRNNEAQAYKASGQLILNQSDIVVFVWDGYYQNKTGGTEDMLHEALNQHIPGIWIDCFAPNKWQLLDDKHHLPATDNNGRLTPEGNEDPGYLSEFIMNSLARKSSFL